MSGAPARTAPGVSIVIPTLNEEFYLPRLLESLTRIRTPLEIIVVDGASEDGTAGIVELFKPHFRGDSSLTLVASETRGISLQRNMGAERAVHGILMFCDADIVFPSAEVYEKLVAEFALNTYAVAAPFLRPIEPGKHLKYAYQVLSFIQRTLLRFGRPFFAGSCLLTTKEVFSGVGGFDTNIMLAEDVDYSMRAAKLGRSALIDIYLPVSARRATTYGYAWLLTEIPNIFRLLLTGRLKSETIYYPFGGYSGQAAHHVTKNTGKGRARLRATDG